MRRLRAAAAVALVGAAIAFAAIADRSVRRRQAEGAPVPSTGTQVVVVALPAPEARRFLAHPGKFTAQATVRGAVGLGVYPDSRTGSRFWQAVAEGGPARVAGKPSPLGGRPCLLGRTLNAGGRGYSVVRLLRAGRAEEGALRDALCPTRAAGRPATSQQAIAAGTAEEAAEWIIGAGLSEGPFVVFGTAARAPLIVGVAGKQPFDGVLGGGIARRLGVATPYDVAFTLLNLHGLDRPPGVAGIRLNPYPAPPRSLERLSARLERDAGSDTGVAAATIAVILGGGIVLTIGLLLAGAGRLAMRSARGGAAGVIGYVASLFVPSGRAEVRAVPIVLAFVAAAAAPLGDPARTRRQIGWILAAGSLAIACLTIAAAFLPDGEPALSLWGNPLESWRFFGLRNHLSSMLALGALGASLLVKDPSRRPLAAGVAGVAAAVVIGAPALGANFVAVPTMVAGAAFSVFVLLRGRPALLGALGAGAAGTLAFGLALLADSASPLSHGGRAVARVRAGGLDALIRFLDIRFRLNIEEIRGLWGGIAWTALLFAGLVAIFVWAARDETLPRPERAVMAGGSLAALAALALEDTGFLAGGIVALLPGLVAATVLSERVAARTR